MHRREFMLAGSAWAISGCAAPPAADASRGLVDPYPPVAYLPSPPGTVWFAPRIPAYPQPIANERLIADAQRISDALENYVTRWLDGRETAELPDSVLPPGWNRRDFPRWTLYPVDAIRPADQWPLRPAEPIRRDALQGGFPDPNYSYLVMPLYAPFGTTISIEGEFPHARFFDIQVTPSFDPRSYRYDGWGGVGEVPLVDADIEPLPGHVNPFRVGARRDAPDRRYRVELRMAIGDPVALNAAFRPPYFRAPGNVRVGGAILHQGPYADPQGQGHKRGRWDHGSIWIRYYRPDPGQGALGGVPLPKVVFRHPDGRRYALHADNTRFLARVNRRVAPRATWREPTALTGPAAGWTKQAGILRAIYSGFAIETGWGGKEYVRLFDRGAMARGAELSSPNDFEQSATSCTYIDYLVRSMHCGRGRVVVLTGRLPTFPRIDKATATMERAELRYWSLTGYVVPEGWDMLGAVTDPDYPGGLAAHGIMDADLVLNAGRRYVIALSRPEDRPRNATREAGVTWADWGLAGTVSWTLRWLTVGPEWTSPVAPTPARLGRRAEWAEPAFDPAVLPNHSRGELGDYLPRVHYLTRAEFERLGGAVGVNDVPAWSA